MISCYAISMLYDNTQIVTITGTSVRCNCHCDTEPGVDTGARWRAGTRGLLWSPDRDISQYATTSQAGGASQDTNENSASDYELISSIQFLLHKKYKCWNNIIIMACAWQIKCDQTRRHSHNNLARNEHIYLKIQNSSRNKHRTTELELLRV